MNLFLTDRWNKSFVWLKLKISVTLCENDRQSTSFFNFSTCFGSANTSLSLNNLNGSSMNWRDPANRKRFILSIINTRDSKKMFKMLIARAYIQNSQILGFSFRPFRHSLYSNLWIKDWNIYIKWVLITSITNCSTIYVSQDNKLLSLELLNF